MKNDFVTEIKEDLIVIIKVTPNASKDQLIWNGLYLAVKVTCSPDKEKANQAVLFLLSKSLKIAKSRMTILQGRHSKQKKILIQNFNKALFLNSLQSLL